MQGLRPHQAQALLPVRGVSPACDDTNDPDMKEPERPSRSLWGLEKLVYATPKSASISTQKVGPLL